MRRYLIALLISICSTVMVYAQGASSAVEYFITNTASKKDIKQVQKSFKKHQMKLEVSKVEHEDGKIRKMTLKLSSERGQVQGSFSDFKKIRIAADENGKMTITNAS
jgi:major membrane immunogen (membrane-anchored lipoprotein)